MGPIAVPKSGPGFHGCGHWAYRQERRTPTDLELTSTASRDSGGMPACEARMMTAATAQFQGQIPQTLKIQSVFNYQYKASTICGRCCKTSSWCSFISFRFL